jgi:hypothetical protein
MLGIARELARHNLPLVGINQGRLGFITDVPLAHYRETLQSMVAGDYEEEHRTMIEGGVWRDGDKIFDGLSMTRWWSAAAPPPAWSNCASTSATSSSPTCVPTA